MREAPPARPVQRTPGSDGAEGRPRRRALLVRRPRRPRLHRRRPGRTIDPTWDASRHAVFTCGTTGPPPPPPTGGVRVNEVMTGDTGAAADEFVELYNAGSTPAAIGGWKPVYRSAAGTSDVTLVTIPDGTTLAAGAFLLAGGSGYSAPPAADISFSTGLAGTAAASASARRTARSSTPSATARRPTRARRGGRSPRPLRPRARASSGLRRRRHERQRR